MQIVRAAPSDLQTVQQIVRTTISEIYPHYYPAGAVAFFLAHHSDAAVSADLEQGLVWLCQSDAGETVGTVTVNGNEINRLFVLPSQQGRGFGRALLTFAEEQIAAEYDSIVLDASFSAKAIYLKRGYRETGFHTICAGDDFLCYDEMKKQM